ncbi:MAG: PAS domain S-box protein [Bacteroidia bacterium]|nr:PAS domain S-box protein [Bacteroidia bacterium]
MDISALDTQSLQQLVDELLQTKADLEAKRLLEAKLSELSGIMRWQPEDTFSSWGDRLLTHIIEQVDGLQACLYILEKDKKEGPYLKLISSYATAPEFKVERVNIGEGIVGEVARSLKPVFYTHLTQVESRSYTGLTVLSPRTLLIKPLIYNDILEGVLEITSIKDWGKQETELFSRLGEIIAANIMSIRSQEAMRILYQEAQEKTEALLAQEEEMRQNVEELQATQEQMRRQQKLLEDREARLSAIINSTQDFILSLNTELQVVLYNKAFEQFAQNTWQVQEIEQKKLSEILPADIWQQIQLLCSQALAGNFQSKEIIALIDNTILHFDITLNPIKTTENEVVGMVLVARNITTKKAQELELLDFKIFIESLLNSTNIMFIATDKQGIIQYCNNATTQKLEYTSEELIGKLPILAFHEPQEIKTAAAELASTFGISISHDWQVLSYLPMQGDIYEREWTYIRKDGSRFPVWISISVLKNAKGEITGLLFVSQDLSEKKKAEALIASQAQEIKYFQNFLESALNSAEFAFIATDDAGIIQYWNRGAELQLGYRAEEIVKKVTFTDLLQETELAEAYQALRKQWGDELKPGFEIFKFLPYQDKVYEGEWTFTRKNKTQFPGYLSITAWKNTEGQPAGLLAIMQDITQKKSHEETIRAQNLELAAREKQLRKNLEELEASRKELEKAKEEIERIGREEAARTQEIIENQRKIMAKAMERMQQKERELQNKIEEQAKLIAELQQQLEASNKSKKK